MQRDYGDSYEDIKRKGFLQGEYEMRKALFEKVKQGDTGAIAQWNILKAILQK